MTALSTAFLGSGHCLAMCGGLAAAAGPEHKTTALYQAGRLAGYLAMGTAAGAAGHLAFHSIALGWASALIMSTCLILGGIRAWPSDGPPQRRASRPNAFSRRIQRLNPLRIAHPSVRALAMGAFTAFLPCGWLLSFALVAAGTGSPWLGAAVLAALWAGSLPALAAGPIVLRAFSRDAGRLQRRIVAVALVLLGGLNLAHKLPTAEAVPSCHHHAMETR